MYNKYKHHQKILVYLNSKRDEYLEHLELNKKNKLKVFGTHDNSFTAEKISSDLKIDVYMVKETLVDLCELGFVNSNKFKYSLKESTKVYIDSKYFEKKRSDYLEIKVLNIVKNTIIIVLGIFSIFSFIKTQIYQNKSYQDKIQELQLEVESIRKEQAKIEKMILNDSLMRAYTVH
tara:strand:- start:251 stop:778 length:528 start_codon:yes stop_codon:yes gene_type:complete